MHEDTIRVFFLILTPISLFMSISSFIITLACKKTKNKRIKKRRRSKKELKVEEEIQTLTPEELNTLKAEINRILKEEVTNKDNIKKKEA